MVVADVCCGTSFSSITLHGRYGVHAIPWRSEIAALVESLKEEVESTSFLNSSIDHPGAGEPNIEIEANPFNENIQFDNLYLEPNSVDTKTAVVQIGASAHNIKLDGFNISNVPKADDAYAVDIAAWAGPTNDIFINGKTQASGRNLVNDHVTGARVKVAPDFGQGPAYFSGTVIASAFVVPGSTSGSVTHTAPAVAGETTITDPAASGTTSLAAAEYCGATTGDEQSCARNIQILPIIVWGEVRLNSAASQAIKKLPFTDALYSCTGSDLTTATGIITFLSYAADSVTIQETSGQDTDHLRYICVGH